MPEGPSLEFVAGRFTPEREEAQPRAGSVGVVSPATSTGVREPPKTEEDPPATEEEPPARDEEPLGDGAAGSRVWSRTEGRDPDSFFYGSELAHRHLHDPAVMPEVSTAPKMLRRKVLPRISPACAALTVRGPLPLFSVLPLSFVA